MPDALVTASLSAAPRHLAIATGGDDKPKCSKFKRYPVGYFHIDIAEVRTEEGRLHLFVAIDRTSKFALVELHERATRRIAGEFLHVVVAAVPYRVHTVLTDRSAKR